MQRTLCQQGETTALSCRHNIIASIFKRVVLVFACGHIHIIATRAYRRPSGSADTFELRASSRSSRFVRRILCDYTGDGTIELRLVMRQDTQRRSELSLASLQRSCRPQDRRSVSTESITSPLSPKVPLSLFTLPARVCVCGVIQYPPKSISSNQRVMHVPEKLCHV